MASLHHSQHADAPAGGTHHPPTQRDRDYNKVRPNTIKELTTILKAIEKEGNERVRALTRQARVVVEGIEEQLRVQKTCEEILWHVKETKAKANNYLLAT